MQGVCVVDRGEGCTTTGILPICLIFGSDGVDVKSFQYFISCHVSDLCMLMPINIHAFYIGKETVFIPYCSCKIALFY